MIHQLLKGFLIFLLLSACVNSTSNTNEITSKEIQKEGVLMPVPEKRWEANAATSEGISNMQELVSNFKDEQTSEGYDLLRNQLEAEFAGILKKCTMKGEAHDRLHDYLMPMKSYFNDLQSGDIAKAKNAYENLADHLTQYTIYFE